MLNVILVLYLAMGKTDIYNIYLDTKLYDYLSQWIYTCGN